MRLEGAVALVTGANRGIGKRIVGELARRGAARIYAAARNKDDVRVDDALRQRVTPIALDVTNEEHVRRAVAHCSDITLLINNAGVNHNKGLIAANDLRAARAEMETNYFGTLSMCRSFAPVLRSNGGGAIVNVLSILAKIGLPAMGSLCASKAASLRMTECIRAELSRHGTRVIAFMPGAVDTDMTRGFHKEPKGTPEDAAARLLDGVERDVEEVYFGERTEYVNRMLMSDPKELEREYAKLLPA